MRPITLLFGPLLILAAMNCMGQARSEQRHLFSFSQLEIRGSQYSTAAVRRALRFDTAVLDAISSKAPPEELSRVLETRIAALLQRVGINQADVSVSFSATETSEHASHALDDFEAPRKVIVDVREGTQYPFGELRIIDATPEVTQTILQRVDLPAPGTPIPLDDPSLQQLHGILEVAFADAGYPLARFRVAPEYDTPASTADYVVDLETLGRPALIGQIDVIGNQQHESSDILQYLAIDRDRIFDHRERARLVNLLQNSQRFYQTDIRLKKPESESDDFVLQIEVGEIQGIADLGQPLSRKDETLLKVADWMQRFLSGEHDLVFSNHPFQGVISASKGVLISIGDDLSPLETSCDQTNPQSTPRPLATLIVDGSGFTLYGFETKAYFHFPVEMHLEFATATAVTAIQAERKSVLHANGRIVKGKNDAAFIVTPAGPSPQSILTLSESFNWQWEGDWLVAPWWDDENGQRASEEPGDGNVTIRIHADTGELAIGSPDTSSSDPAVYFCPGAFAETKNRHLQQTAEFVAMRHPLADTIELLSKFNHCEMVDDLLHARVDYVVGVVDFVLFLFSKGLWHEIQSSWVQTESWQIDKAESFRLLSMSDFSTIDDDWSLAEWCDFGLVHVDDWFPVDSWPHRLASVTMANYTGRSEQERWSSHEWMTVFVHETQGPVLDWVRALWTADQIEYANYYAYRGYTHATLEGFRRDYEPLVDDRYLCGRLVQRALEILEQQTPEDLTLALEKLPPQMADVIRGLVSHMQVQREGALDTRVRRALDTYWEVELRQTVVDGLQAAASQS